MRSGTISVPEALGISVLGFCIVFVVLAILILVVKLISLASGTKKRAAAPAAPQATAAAAQAAPSVPASGSAGGCDIHDVDERTAAILMAIVADRLGAPLNELRFRSIKEIK